MFVEMFDLMWSLFIEKMKAFFKKLFIFWKNVLMNA